MIPKIFDSPVSRLKALVGLMILLSGCAAISQPTPSPHQGRADELGRCADFFASLDQRTFRAKALDAGSFRVKGYPYLRVDRFNASFGGEVAESAKFSEWLDRMQTLDQRARRLEIANLNGAGDQSGLNLKVKMCGDRLKAADFREPKQREALAQQVSVPDEYLDARRWVGLYPLTRWGVALGVSAWQAEARETFSLNPPPASPNTVRYLPPHGESGAFAREIVAGVERDPLGIPVLSSEDIEALFRQYAPVWEVTVESDADRIGSPFWDRQGRLAVDFRRPQTYTLLSFTRFQRQILIQLNYVIWFAARPKTGPLDLYGGRLDGVTLRVTLDARGEPLLYETVHNCGCYYKAYPTARLPVAEQIAYAEPPLIFEAPQLDLKRRHLTLTLAAGTHHVARLYPSSRQMPSPALRYALGDYHQLRSLPYTGSSRKSMFNGLGIAHGSERLERFILWPMGVLSPGAMRQWGRHAVAFIGKRHFDDPFYMERMFLPALP